MWLDRKDRILASGLVYNALSMKDGTAGTVSTGQITELLTPFLDPDALTDSQLLAIKSYLNLLLKWNAKLNLTAIRNPREMVTRHFGESLFAARQLFPVGDSRDSVIDVGSGAGFPGLPIKLWSPQVELTLIESNQRKATFLRELIRALDLKSVSVVTERAGSVSFKASVVTLRAVEQFDRVLPAALGLVMPGGRIGLLIGEAQVGRARSLSTEVHWQSPIEIPLSNSRRLLIGQKLKS